MTNATGTIFRALGLLITLIILWYMIILGIYFIGSLVFGFAFDIKMSLLSFAIFICFRMFYPKNVFV